MSRCGKILSVFLFASALLSGAWGNAWGQDYIEGEALVVMKGMSGGPGLHTKASLEASETRVAESAASLAGGRVATLHGYMTPESDKVFALIKSDSKTTEQLIDELKANPDVIAASPNRVVSVSGNPQGYTGKLTGNPNQWGLAAINAPTAWNWDIPAIPPLSANDYWGSRSIKVAVIDSGVQSGYNYFNEIDNPKFSNLDIGNSKDFTKSSVGIDDENGHGTHVSGIIGAAPGASHQIVGVSPRVSIITLKVVGSDGKGDVSNVLRALKHVSDLIDKKNRIKVINLSLGWGYKNAKSPSDLLGTAEYMAFKEMDDREDAPIIVVAAGNKSLRRRSDICVDADQPRRLLCDLI